MLPIYVGAYHRFIPFPQQPAGKFHSGGVGLFRGSLAGGIGVNDVIAQYAALLVPAALGGLHILIGTFRVTVDPRNKLVGLCGILRVGEDALQAGLFLVQRIVHAMIQPPVYRDDFIVGH